MSLICSMAVLLTLTICCSLTNVLADVCDPNPCEEHGRCEQFSGGYNWGYQCICQSGYIGAQCQWDNYYCRNDTKTPCRNNGTCVDTDDGRFCKCQFGTSKSVKFGGHYCEKIDPCEACPTGTIQCQTAPTRPSGVICIGPKYVELPMDQQKK